jgi:hypothetical protein
MAGEGYTGRCGAVRCGAVQSAERGEQFVADVLRPARGQARQPRWSRRGDGVMCRKSAGEKREVTSGVVVARRAPSDRPPLSGVGGAHVVLTASDRESPLAQYLV